MAKWHLMNVYPGDDLNAALTTGAPLKLGSGTYPHTSGVLNLPDGAFVVGNGIGETIIDAGLKVGSGSYLSGFTAGSGSAHRFRPGSAWSEFHNVRFRAPGNVRVWDACDYTYWGSPAKRDRADFHDIWWAGCEWEFSEEGCCLFELWPDCRAGGGNVHDLLFDECTFGVKNAQGQFSPQRVGMLIQPSPPEHGTGGPRPGSSIDYAFDWSVIDHGIGVPGRTSLIFRGCDFIGQTSLASFDLCDNMRSYMMTTIRYEDGRPKYTSSTNGTQAERDACPDRVCTHGVYFEDCRFADSYIPEIGRNCPDNSYPDHMADNPVRYFARDAVLEHDAQLYGLVAP